ncbi:g-protein beta wd-40 repeats containing [Fusarium flagelliforme]|uniref:G-protein beta wd-40 repeats containing n=1 Tax=Fusarium flagelliforme TaxID=2675880 RepID=A0A395M6Y9_9HYPO|nr:g-protein beta wd-40 repeats containing [Fusarium flagelliforme]
MQATTASDFSPSQLAVLARTEMSSENKRSHQLDSRSDEETSRASKRDRRTDPLPTTSRSFLDKYTVGWMSALPLEMAAAKGMLDQVHPNLTEQDPEDHNTYLLGEVFGHNVVVACLPAGVYGPTTAATVAKDMRRTFRSIRFGLMVGIGGGIPSNKHDIRLGDVVVGQPTATTGGVIQYDRGKSLQEQGFERSGMLNAPPQVLLAALSRLQAEYLTEDSRIPEFLADLPKKMKKRFGHPGASNDHLFLAKYPHIKDNPTCEQCDHAQTVDREDREDTEPVIHYGTIASGNQVIKDATIRDQLGKELGILCFEMEAAGLQDYPSLTVRGICDYADSHKNDTWQYYAAATAAAFTKELLSFIPPPRVLQEDPIPQLVSIVNETLDVSKQYLDVSSKTLGEQRRTNQILEDRAVDLHVVHEACYNSADVGDSPRCEANTRVRIQRKIKQWADKDDGEPFLWLVGPAGTGKSTLIRSVADSFHQDKRLAAGYFFKRGEQGRNDTGRLFSTLAMQLADAIPCFKNSLRVSVGDTDRDSMDKKDLRFQFERLLKNPIETLPILNTKGPPRVIVLDALDECERPENLPRVLAFLSEICNNSAGPLHLRIVLTGRSDPRVLRALRSLKEEESVRELQLHKAYIEDTKADIRTYLETKFTEIRTDAKIQQDPWPSLKDLNHLVHLATSPEPLFIYGATILRFVYDVNLPRDPKVQLAIWLKQCEDDRCQLHQMYDPILKQLFESIRETDVEQKLHLLLGALVLVTTPLSLTSLSSLLSIDIDTISFWLSYLHGVLDVPSGSQKPIRLLHKSFSDFLLSEAKPDHDYHFQLDPREHFLHWLEVSALLRQTSDALEALQDLSDLVKSSFKSSSELVDFLKDATRTISSFASIIERAPMQTYASLILFSPVASRVRQQFWDQRLPPHSHIEGVKSNWDARVQAFDVGQRVQGLAFSPDGKLLASADTNVRVFNALTGNHLMTFGADCDPQDVVFSYNSQLLAATYPGRDGTVKVWDRTTWKEVQTIKTSAIVIAIAFSPDDEVLVLISSHDNTQSDKASVKFWSVRSRVLQKEMNFHRRLDPYFLERIAISPSLEQFAICSTNGTVVLWSLVTETAQHTFSVDGSEVFALAFSPDGGLLAVSQLLASKAPSVYIWDLATGSCRNLGLANTTALAFSFDGQVLATTSWYNGLTVWDSAYLDPENDQSLSDTDTAHNSILLFSPNGKLFASHAEHGTIEIWDSQTGKAVLGYGTWWMAQGNRYLSGIGE